MAQLRGLASCSSPQPSLHHRSLQDYLEQGPLLVHSTATSLVIRHCVTPLRPLFTAGLNKHFFSLVVADRQKRAEAGLPSQPPGPLVKLFNAVVSHLSHQASREELTALQWPLPEFATLSKFSPGTLPPLHWNLPSYLQELQDFLASLTMRDDCRDLPRVEGEWSELCAECLAYVGSLRLRPNAAHSSIILLSRYTHVHVQYLV